MQNIMFSNLRKTGIIRAISFFFCFVSCTCAHAQVSELPQFRNWLSEFISEKDVSNLFADFEKEEISEARRLKEIASLEEKNKEDKRLVQDEIKDIELKIKNLGVMERDEFETREHFAERKKQHDAYQQKIKQLNAEIQAIDKSYNQALPQKKEKTPPSFDGNVKLFNKHLVLEKFDIDNLCFPCSVKLSSSFLSSTNIELNSFYKESEDKKWKGGIYYIDEELTKKNEDDPNRVVDFMFKRDEKVEYAHAFNLYFSSPEEARSFKTEFEAGRVSINVPVKIAFSLSQGRDSVLVSPEETEIDGSAVAADLGELAIKIGIGMIAESFSPGSSANIPNEPSNRKLRRVTKPAEYRYYTTYYLEGKINSFPEKVVYPSSRSSIPSSRQNERRSWVEEWKQENNRKH